MAGVHVTVVTCENDQRVFCQSVSLKRFQNSSDLLIDLLGESAIDPAIDSPLSFVVKFADRLGGSDGGDFQIELDCRRFQIGNPKVIWQWR